MEIAYRMGHGDETITVYPYPASAAVTVELGEEWRHLPCCLEDERSMDQLLRAVADYVWPGHSWDVVWYHRAEESL